MDFAKDIDQRTGWPDELRVLLQQFPRESWRDRASPLVRFWIDKHDYFRHQSKTLQQAAADYRNQRSTPSEFTTWIAPRLQSFLAHLHGHHQIEDFHYFPAFRAADPRLAAGFDVLANDHELLHQGIVDSVEAANALITTLRAGPENMDAQRHAVDRYVDVSALIHSRLGRHLDDEEDLIIPLMLARDE